MDIDIAGFDCVLFCFCVDKLYLCREEHSKVSDEDSFLERCGAVMGETPRKPSSGIQEKAVKAVIKAQGKY